MLITSQSNHKLHTTGPLFPRCLTFTFSPFEPPTTFIILFSSFIIKWRHVPLISLVAFQEFRKAEFFGVLCWCFPQRQTRKLSTLLRLCFDHWCSQHLSLSHLRFAARPTWLGLVDLGRFFTPNESMIRFGLVVKCFCQILSLISWNTQCLICLRFWVAKTFQLLDDVGKDYLCRCLAFRIRNARRSFPNCLTLFLRQKLPFLGQTA